MSESTNPDGWIRLRIPGLIPPGIDRTLPSDTGTITDDGTVDVAATDATLVLEEPDAIDAGVDVGVGLHSGNFYCRPVAVRDQRTTEQAARREQAERARDRAAAWERRRDREFWRGYQLPFEHGVARKGRRGELQKGSSGTGVTSQSVVNLSVQVEKPRGASTTPDSRDGNYPMAARESRRSRREGCHSCL